MMDIKRKRALSEHMAEKVVGKELATVWWNGPNKAFGGKTPNEQWNIEPDEVFRYLASYCLGK